MDLFAPFVRPSVFAGLLYPAVIPFVMAVRKNSGICASSVVRRYGTGNAFISFRVVSIQVTLMMASVSFFIVSASIGIFWLIRCISEL